MSKLSVNYGNRNLQDSHKNQNPDPVWNFDFTESQNSDKCRLNLRLNWYIFTIGKTHTENQHNYYDNPIHALVGLFGTSYLVSES